MSSLREVPSASYRFTAASSFSRIVSKAPVTWPSSSEPVRCRQVKAKVSFADADSGIAKPCQGRDDAGGNPPTQEGVAPEEERKKADEAERASEQRCPGHTEVHRRVPGLPSSNRKFQISSGGRRFMEPACKPQSRCQRQSECQREPCCGSAPIMPPSTPPEERYTSRSPRNISHHPGVFLPNTWSRAARVCGSERAPGLSFTSG